MNHYIMFLLFYIPILFFFFSLNSNHCKDQQQLWALKENYFGEFTLKITQNKNSRKTWSRPESNWNWKTNILSFSMIHTFSWQIRSDLSFPSLFFKGDWFKDRKFGNYFLIYSFFTLMCIFTFSFIHLIFSLSGWSVIMWYNNLY